MTQHPGFDLLDKAHLVLLASQLALVAGWIATNGLDSVPNGFLVLVLCTAIVAAGVRRLAGAGLNRGAVGWVIAWRIAALAVLVAATLLVVSLRYFSVGLPAATPQLIFSLLWLVVALKGAAVGKLSPGGPIGLRVPWTLNSRRAWEKGHRTLGRILFWGGVIGLALSLSIPPMTSIVLWVLLVITALILALVEARQAWRADPERAVR